MKLASIVLAVVIAAQAASVAAAPRRCDIDLNVIDQDPKGLNVRSTPSLTGSAVLASLKTKETWVQVHVTGQDGAWMSIDRATRYDDNLPTGEQVLWTGKGWVATSKLGTEEMNVAAAILAEPREGARRLMKISGDIPDTRPIVILGCDGFYAQLRIGSVTGWSRQFCSNQYTNCN